MSKHTVSAVDRKPLWRVMSALLGVIAMVLALAVTGTAANAADGTDDTGTSQSASGTPTEVPVPTGEATDDPAEDPDSTDTMDAGSEDGTETSGSSEVSNIGILAATGNPPVVTVTKTLVTPGPFTPGQQFTYRIQYACSSLETACPNATLTDTIPVDLDFITNTSTGDPSTISYDPGTRELKVVFTSIVDGAGTLGLIAGHNGQMMVTATFLDGTIDGTTANNCVNIAADGAAADQSCAAAEARTTPTYGVSVKKSYDAPFTGDTATSGVQGTGATTTLDLKATVGGNQPADMVTVVDPDPGQTASNNPFDSFDLADIKTLSLPVGIEAEIQVKSSGAYSTVGTYSSGASVTLPGVSGIDVGVVTGIQVVYSCSSPAPVGSVCVNGKIPASISLEIKAGVQLRDVLRSNLGQTVAPGTIHNQAKVTATYPGADPKTHTDTADYSVVAQTATVTASKTIGPDTAQEKSGADVTMTVGGKNSGNIAGTGMTVTDPDPTSSTKPFDHFTFKSFNVLSSLPAGVTTEVKVLKSGLWVSIGSGLTNGKTPSLGAVSPGDVEGVQYIYTGPIAPKAEIKNSFVTTLKDTVTDGTLNPANCAAVSMTTAAGGAAGQDQACAPFTVTQISTSITAGKSFSSTSGVAHTGAVTTVTLSGKNGSNVPISSFQLVDPGTGSDATFATFDFTGFGKLTAPVGTTWKVEVYDGGSWQSVGTYDAGSTPLSGDLPIDAGEVQGVRYTLASGSIPANTNAISTKVGLQVRGTLRGGTQTPIDSGAVKNCTTAISTGISDASACAHYTINAINPGTGVGVGKNIAKATVVQNTGEATNVTLTGKNGANVPVTSLTLEDSPTTATVFWNSFDFNGFGSTGWPTGATGLKVESFDGTTWQLVNNYSASGTPSLPAGVDNSDVHGVRYTWTGTIAADATVSPNFSAKVKDGAVTGAVRDCVLQTYSGGLVTTPVTKSACDNVTITAQNHEVNQSKSFSPGTGTIGLSPTTTATLTVKNNSNVPLGSIVVTDPDGTTTPFDKFDLTGFGPVTLPSNVQVLIEAYDGTWQTVQTRTNGQAVTVPGGITVGNVTAVRLTFSGTGSNQIPASQSAAMSVGVKLQLRDTVRGSSTAVDTTPIKNCFATTTNPAATLTGDPCATYTQQAQSPGVSAAKTWSPSTGIRDELPASTITIKGRNSGNVPVDALVLQDPALADPAPAVVDTAFDYFDVTGFTGLVLPQGANQVKIDVLTADGTWHGGTASATLPTDLTGYGIGWGDIVGMRATFSNADSATKLPVVTDAIKTGNVGISVKLRQTLRSTGGAIDVPPSGSTVVDNESSALVVYQGNPGNPQTADAKYTVTSGTVKVAPKKVLYPIGSSTDVNPNQALFYQLQIKNTGDRNLVAPVVLDKFNPAQLGYDPSQAYPTGSYQFDVNGSSLTGFGLVVDSSTSGEVKFTFAAGDYLAPGQTAYIRIVLTTLPGLAAGTVVTNEYGITYDVSANGPVKCAPGSSSVVVDNVTYCGDSTQVKIIKAESMSSIKKIKGDGIPFTNIPNPGASCPNVAGYTYYPCIAHTHVGGIFDYQLQITDSGNVPIKNARAIDVLPHIGDTGVLLTGQHRATAWTPTFIGPVTVTGLPAGATYTMYYANTYTPSTAALSNNGGAWAGDWSTTDFGVDTKAIAIDVITTDNAPIPPAGSFTLHWQMQAPAVSPAVGSIAWNSFAFTGEPTDGTGWLLAAEPRKVGIDLANPSVQVQKTTAPQGSNGTFSFTLAPVGDAVGGGTESVTTVNGTKSTTPWSNLTPGGTYTLTESATAGDAPSFVAGTFSCVNSANSDAIILTTPTDGGVQFVAPANGVVICSMTNTLRPTVTVHKTAVGGNGIFAFVLTQLDPALLESVEGTEETRQVDTSTEDLTASWGPAGLIPGGTYRITETAKSQWIPTFNGCFVGELSISEDVSEQSGGTFVAEAGADIYCDFTNTYSPPPPPTTPPTTSTPPTTTSISVLPTTSIAVSGESSSVDSVVTTTSGGGIEVLPTSKTSAGDIAYTGVNAYGMAMLALLLLGGGALVLTIGSVWRRKSHKH